LGPRCQITRAGIKHPVDGGCEADQGSVELALTGDERFDEGRRELKFHPVSVSASLRQAVFCFAQS
jgi:hypothetical protein